MTTFPPGPMTSLVDSAVRFYLAESTSPPLRLGDLVDPAEPAGLSLGYGTSRADEELRSLVAAGCGVGADEVLVTVGAVEAMFLLAQERWAPGGRALVVGPSFPPARAVPGGLGSPVDDVALRFDDGYRLDVDAVAAARTRVVTCSSLSKAHGAPGLRVGWLTCTDPDLYERLRNAKFVTTIACSGPDEFLATRVLRREPEILAARAAALGAALAELEAWAADRPVELVRPDGGALCCLRLPPGSDVDAFHRRLADRDVRVSPGAWFGDEERVFRLGFGHLPPADLTEALHRLGDALTP